MTAMLVLVAALALGILVLLKSVSGGIPMTPENVRKIAEAIAYAEGFYTAGSRPARNHNPGDMTEDLIGKAVGTDGPFAVYASDADGFENLYAQINKWLNGTSSHATADSTISDISQFYTADNQTTWATNVANRLGVSLDTPIKEVV
jgi:hypothetical protein